MKSSEIKVGDVLATTRMQGRTRIPTGFTIRVTKTGINVAKYSFHKPRLSGVEGLMLDKDGEPLKDINGGDRAPRTYKSVELMPLDRAEEIRDEREQFSHEMERRRRIAVEAEMNVKEILTTFGIDPACINVDFKYNVETGVADPNYLTLLGPAVNELVVKLIRGE